MEKHKPCPDPFCMDCRCAVLEAENTRLRELLGGRAEAAHLAAILLVGEHAHKGDSFKNCVNGKCLKARAALEHADGQ